MGSYGALAEFLRDEDEPVLSPADDRLTRATARGAIRFDRAAERLVPIGIDVELPEGNRIERAIALCFDLDEAQCAGRAALTELGPDENAILPDHRRDILFDMGLGLVQCDFCIRTSSPELQEVLRANAGRSLFEPDNPAMAAILRHHPHRVVITRAGRVEVHQKIGGPETGGISPDGPHTHVLPDLLALQVTHDPRTPLPEGLVPVAHIYPGTA